MPARLPSWAWVCGLTVGAVAAVTVLAVQADRGAGPAPAVATPRPTVTASELPVAEESPVIAVPEGSGEGRRIVYSLSTRRVWLVDAADVARRDFAVWPGTVDPGIGAYTVGARREATTGSDGVPIEHVVYFALRDGVSVAFSHAVDGSSPPVGSPGARTGGIRVPKEDGEALWVFATPGTPVRVVD
ncbi:L,D-transpeptidase [Streptomyces sp. ZYX-F-203]